MGCSVIGSTTVFGAVGLGSSPGTPALVWQNNSWGQEEKGGATVNLPEEHPCSFTPYTTA